MADADADDDDAGARLADGAEDDEPVMLLSVVELDFPWSRFGETE
ncbi:hypothetical protein [Edaphobacter bradus]|nr:hypothetical protein [Edaphobacter bradus]